MQVELSAIVAKYRELLAQRTHENICYQLAIQKYEEEIQNLKDQLEEFKGGEDASGRVIEASENEDE